MGELVLKIISFIVILLSSSLADASEPYCPKTISETKPIDTKTPSISPLPYAQKVKFIFKNELYEIPVGYLDPLPLKVRTKETGGKVDVDGVNNIGNLGLTFWYPKLRYPEIQAGIFLGAKSLCENGRPKPKSNEYIVKVYLKENDKKPNQAEALDQEYKSYIHSWNNITPDFKAVQKDEDGLTKFYLSYKNKSNGVFYYKRFKDNDPSLLLRCGTGECMGDVYHKSKDVFYEIHFPDDHLQDFFKIDKAIFTLLDQWKVKNGENR